MQAVATKGMIVDASLGKECEERAQAAEEKSNQSLRELLEIELLVSALRKELAVAREQLRTTAGEDAGGSLSRVQEELVAVQAELDTANVAIAERKANDCVVAKHMEELRERDTELCAKAKAANEVLAVIRQQLRRKEEKLAEAERELLRTKGHLVEAKEALTATAAQLAETKDELTLSTGLREGREELKVINDAEMQKIIDDLRTQLATRQDPFAAGATISAAGAEARAISRELLAEQLEEATAEAAKLTAEAAQAKLDQTKLCAEIERLEANPSDDSLAAQNKNIKESLAEMVIEHADEVEKMKTSLSVALAAHEASQAQLREVRDLMDQEREASEAQLREVRDLVDQANVAAALVEKAKEAFDEPDGKPKTQMEVLLELVCASAGEDYTTDLKEVCRYLRTYCGDLDELLESKNAKIDKLGAQVFELEDALRNSGSSLPVSDRPKVVASSSSSGADRPKVAASSSSSVSDRPKAVPKQSKKRAASPVPSGRKTKKPRADVVMTTCVACGHDHEDPKMSMCDRCDGAVCPGCWPTPEVPYCCSTCRVPVTKVLGVFHSAAGFLHNNTGFDEVSQPERDNWVTHKSMIGSRYKKAAEWGSDVVDRLYARAQWEGGGSSIHSLRFFLQNHATSFAPLLASHLQRAAHANKKIYEDLIARAHQSIQ